MALITKRCRFLHTPKTGGIWVNTAIANAGITVAVAAEHLNVYNAPGHGMFTIAFIRAPWPWWKSYWVFKKKRGWDRENDFDMECWSDDFEQFVGNVISRRPGYWTEVCSLFVGRPGEEIDFIGRYERLVDDLVRGLQLAGETFDERRLRATPKANCGDYQRFSPVCSEELQTRLLEAEREGIERFGYQNVVE